MKFLRFKETLIAERKHPVLSATRTVHIEEAVLIVLLKEPPNWRFTTYTILMEQCTDYRDLSIE